MGVSTDGFIAYGVLLADPDTLPDHDWAYDQAGSWRKDQGYVPIVDLDAMYERGERPTPEQRQIEIENQKAWHAAHPCPIQFVNYCSDNYEQWMAVVPATLKRASRGFPVPFDPADLQGDKTAQTEALLAFLRDHEIALDDETPSPCWLIGSYWG